MYFNFVPSFRFHSELLFLLIYINNCFIIDVADIEIGNYSNELIECTNR